MVPIRSYRRTLSILLIIGLGIIVFRLTAFASVAGIEHWNRSAISRISPPADAYAFDVFGDSEKAFSVLTGIVESINRENSVLVVGAGDLVRVGKGRDYTNLLFQLRMLRIPFLAVPGNRDLKGDGYLYYNHIFGPRYYSTPVGPDYFIFLDNAVDGMIDPEQMEWLKQELEKASQYRYRFVFMHIPLYDPGLGAYAQGHSVNSIEHARELNNLFDHSNVSLLVTAHIHGYYKGVWGRTPFIITGGAGGELHAKDPAHGFYHYVHISATDEGIDVTIRPVKVRPGMIAGFVSYLRVALHSIRSTFWS